MAARSREAIISEILNICMESVCKTGIVTRANLNFKTVGPYLDLLVRNGLIDIIQESNTMYKTTPKGAQLRENFRLIQNGLSIETNLANGIKANQ